VCVVMTQTFSRFYRREFPVMVALATAVGESRIASEDTAQEAFVNAQDRWDDLFSNSRPGSWMRRLTNNLALSTLSRAETEARTSLDWSQVLDNPPNRTMWFEKRYRGFPRSNVLQTQERKH
jgi:DNA-directed RNA polymerase specialized sigma24 family protein